MLANTAYVTKHVLSLFSCNSGYAFNEIYLTGVKMKFFFQYSISLLGIKAPWFSWLAAVTLIVWPAWELYKLFTMSISQMSICKKLTGEINSLKAKRTLSENCGIDSPIVDQLRHMFSAIPFLDAKWASFRSKLIYRPVPYTEDVEQVWLTVSAAEIFPEDIFLGSDFNKRHFHSIPGIVTGIGLLMTFAAILVGLLDVNIVDNKVHGLENLIGGLSGKFVSSVAALFAATAFVILEKRVFHRLNGVRHELVSSIDSLVPRRSETHLLDEISQNISEQTNSFRLFNSDLSRIFTNSLSQSMGPVLERMVTAIDDLNRLTESSKVELLSAITEMNGLLKRSEQSRQESISGQVASLLSDLQKSLSESIEKMSKDFSKSLTGTAQDQFSKVAETIGATAQVLEAMNSQFTSTQTALQELVSLAKQSTESQFSNGSALIERMVKVFSGSLIHMETKLAELSEKMTSTMEASTVKTGEAADEVLEGVRNLNEQTVNQLVTVLNKHEGQLDRVDQLKTALMDAVNEFGTYVTGYNTINSELKSVSKDANSVMLLLSQSASKLNENQDSFNKIAELVNDEIQMLADSNEKQSKLWDDINSSMEQYKATFKTVESSATTILAQIAVHLQNFSRATTDHFNQTVTVANDHISVAVGQLSTSIEQLSEKLDDLSDIVDSIPRR